MGNYLATKTRNARLGNDHPNISLTRLFHRAMGIGLSHVVTILSLKPSAKSAGVKSFCKMKNVTVPWLVSPIESMSLKRWKLSRERSQHLGGWRISKKQKLGA